MSPTLSSSTPTSLDPPVGRALYPSASPPGVRTLIDVLDASTAAHPDAPAIDTGSDVLTYRQLAEEIEQRAERLRRAGVGPGDRVGIRVPSGTAELYLSILATLRAGAAYVPVDADDPEERAATVFHEAGVCVVLGAEGSLTPHEQAPSHGEARLPLPTDDAWIIFTSGSTGKPKGVAVSHASAAAFVDAEARLFLQEEPLGPGDRVLAGLSVAFDASCEEMWLAWRYGACLVPAPRSLVRAGHELGPWLVERGVTVVSTVPTLVALWPADSLDRVRLLIVGGEACPAELVERFAVPGREMWNTYGPTETTVVACAARMFPGEPVRIGLPLDGWTLAVVDEAGEPVPFGGEGELVIAGAGVARYLDPVKDAERFRPNEALGLDRVYRTGDLVKADPKGLVFAGRADDQIKLGGRRIELGEIDAALSALPGVRGAAAAVRSTPAGGQLLVGYVVTDETYDRKQARALLAERMPAALVPVLAEVDDLPTRTSGKVDRNALPWPLPTTADAAEPGEELHGTAATLAVLWEELLGTRPGPDDDFVALGGSSLTAARMASALRENHPGVSVAGLYRHTVLRDMAEHIDSLDASHAPKADKHRRVRPVRRRSGAAQILIQLGLFGIQGLRGLVALATADNVLGLLTPRSWAPQTPWWLVIIGWVLLFSAPGRFAIGALAARTLTRGITPGSYPRGGRVHLRLWAAERLVASFGVPSLTGTPWMHWYARALGCSTGQNIALHAMPPVTGLAELGDGCSVESEADIAGWWLDGEVVHIGAVRIGANARVGHRAMVMPGASLGPGAELAPGACLAGEIPAGHTWIGSPARPDGSSGHRDNCPVRSADSSAHGWPAPRTQRSRRWAVAYALSLIGMPLLSLIAFVPALVITYYLVKDATSLTSVTGRLLLAVPPLTILSTLTAMLVLAGTVRILNRGLKPGLHPADGGVAWRAWLISRILDGARRSLFPIYASLFTPVWMRMLGAKIGRRAELSTVLPLPSLLSVDDGAFLADDTLVAPYELRGGWVRVGHSHIGRRAFVGNSGIVGPDRTVPDHSLIGVLSDAPEHSEPGTSWLGRPAMPLPRVATAADSGRTFDPPKKLILARAGVEFCRVLPLMCGLALGDLVFLGEQRALDAGGLWLAALVGAPLLLLAGLAAGLLATLSKWVLVGRFKVSEHPLWSSFVWRNELYDTFVESLAVPWLAGPFTGTPVLNWWLRTLGVKIGKGVWCDTYWLPETDLISLGDGVSVNRGCVLQTHLFHDRIMRMDTVQLDEGASLGPHGIVLPGTTVGAHTAIAPSSLVMRGESVPAGTRWAGNPIAGEQPAPPALVCVAGQECAA
ncbi:Pls/PosA family non-ribosomal peptide synthetase [Streptomyces sp. NPDC052396]|uniref:Pls/PosA family non-ribosomal peptide synthetase n=1 Tax=Streptomyces sp. NPDC052396 TaxID=3365689 RepID=UPI0037CF6560